MADSMENFQLFHVTETLAQLVQHVKELKEENQFIKAQLIEKFGPTTVVSKGKNLSLSMVMGSEELIVNLSRQMAALTEEVYQMKQQMQTWYCRSQGSEHFAGKNTKVQDVVTGNFVSQHQQDSVGPLVLEYDQESPSETPKKEFTDLPTPRSGILKGFKKREKGINWSQEPMVIEYDQPRPIPQQKPGRQFAPSRFHHLLYCNKGWLQVMSIYLTLGILLIRSPRRGRQMNTATSTKDQGTPPIGV
ncbi:uncharacterized protein LOC143851087 [Tasmannia lanceolata]|uniref:uncharacterized protein LOC143851087 n=1 Tax=Tasmannia lanceolata TaxID=3420 RepID=UPI004063FB6C